MGLIGKVRYRVGYVWGWRLRHWWLDTREGRVAQLALATSLVLGACAWIGRVIGDALAAAHVQLPRAALVTMIVLLSLAVSVIAVRIAGRMLGPSR